MSLDALRSLQEQADSCDVYDPDCSCAGCESLAALATHLLPIAEALEPLDDDRIQYGVCDQHDQFALSRTCYVSDEHCWVCKARKALKALKESLDG